MEITFQDAVEAYLEGGPEGFLDFVLRSELANTWCLRGEGSRDAFDWRVWWNTPRPGTHDGASNLVHMSATLELAWDSTSYYACVLAAILRGRHSDILSDADLQFQAKDLTSRFELRDIIRSSRAINLACKILTPWFAAHPDYEEQSTWHEFRYVHKRNFLGVAYDRASPERFRILLPVDWGPDEIVTAEDAGGLQFCWQGFPLDLSLPRRRGGLARPPESHVRRIVLAPE